MCHVNTKAVSTVMLLGIKETLEDCQHNTRSLEQILPESSEGTDPALP